MKKLIAEGRIREWGISEVDEDYLRRADRICHVSAIQNRYSMMARGYEHMFRICEELRTAYVTFSPLANGYLTGIKGTIDPIGDYRNFMPQYNYKGYEMNKKLLIFLSSLAEEKHRSMAQLSLAWMIEKHDNLIAIPGSKNIERIKENFESQNVHLTKEEIGKIDDFLDKSNLVVFGQ